jgi:hypothetical protein
MQKLQKASRQGDRNDMTRRACGILFALLFLSITFPALGKNYLLHSPKLWTLEEKERLEKENLSTIKELEPVDKQLDRQKGLAEKQKERVKKEKELVEKQKLQLEKQREQIKREKELVEQQKEQNKIEQERERVNKAKDLAEKQKAQLEKQKEQIKKEKEQIKLEKEQVKKEKERIKKEKERVKKEKEQIRKDQILVKDGVSYREVTVQKGDTLYDISRKFSKEGSSYAETLKFNNIKDPDEIVGGDIVKVPLFREKKTKRPSQTKQVKPVAVVTKHQITKKAAINTVPAKTDTTQPPVVSSKAPTTQEVSQPPEIPIPKLHMAPPPTVSGKTTSSQEASQPPEISPTKPREESDLQQPQTSPSTPETSGQKLFEQAIKSYRTGDCQTAIQIFSQFLAEDTTSKLAADASLLIADCYLKLSGK